MNIHEYQAKQIFAEYGVPTPRGMIAHSVEEAVENAKNLVEYLGCKSSIHAGGKDLGGG